MSSLTFLSRIFGVMQGSFKLLWPNILLTLSIGTQMDDDAGTMSSCFVIRSIGLLPANVGNPIYHLTGSIFEKVNLNWENGKIFYIEVRNCNKDNFHIKSVTLNGQSLNRNWLTQQEISNEGTLIIETDRALNKNLFIDNQLIIKKNDK